MCATVVFIGPSWCAPINDLTSNVGHVPKVELVVALFYSGSLVRAVVERRIVTAPVRVAGS